MVDDGELRAGDADRDRTIERLRQAFTEGRLDDEEFQQRLDRAARARTFGDLAALTADLPGGSAPALPGAEVAAAAPAPHPAQPSVPAGSDVAKRGRDLRGGWTAWATVSLLCTVIWLGSWITGGSAAAFWPIWVIGPWGVVMLLATLNRPRD